MRPIALDRRRALAMLASVPFARPSQASAARVIDRERYTPAINGLTVDWLSIDLATGAQTTLAGSRLDDRHPPFSSFKIPNAVIGLESGAATGPDHVRVWDQRRRPAAPHWPPEWRRDQTFRSAFRASAVWYFQDMALEIGAARYREALTRFGYGNALVGDPPDDAWLNPLDERRRLLVSTREQARFLASLLERRLGVSDATLAVLAEISALTTLGSNTLHGKTGAGPTIPRRTDGAFDGWFVGFLARAAMPPVVFALHMRGPSFAAIRTARQSLAEALLRDISVW